MPKLGIYPPPIIVLYFDSIMRRLWLCRTLSNEEF